MAAPPLAAGAPPAAHGAATLYTILIASTTACHVYKAATLAGARLPHLDLAAWSSAVLAANTPPSPATAGLLLFLYLLTHLASTEANRVASGGGEPPRAAAAAGTSAAAAATTSPPATPPGTPRGRRTRPFKPRSPSTRSRPSSTTVAAQDDRAATTAADNELLTPTPSALAYLLCTSRSAAYDAVRAARDLIAESFTHGRFYAGCLSLRHVLVGFETPATEDAYLLFKAHSLRSADVTNLWVLTGLRAAAVVRTALAAQLLTRTKLLGLTLGGVSLACGVVLLLLFQLPSAARFRLRHRETLMMSQGLFCILSMVACSASGAVPTDVRILTSSRMPPFILLVVFCPLVQQMRVPRALFVSTTCVASFHLYMRTHGADGALLWELGALMWAGCVLVAAAADAHARHRFLDQAAAAASQITYDDSQSSDDDTDY